jgi:hypothetical protein
MDRYGARMPDPGEVEYAVELEATFDVTIFSTVIGPRGLSRQGVEELVERNWTWVSADKNVLQESSWSLTEFQERASE